jgi:hypothetical protein
MHFMHLILVDFESDFGAQCAPYEKDKNAVYEEGCALHTKKYFIHQYGRVDLMYQIELK